MRECALRRQRLSGFLAPDVCLSEVLANCFPSAHRLTLVVPGAGARRQSPLQPPHTHTHAQTGAVSAAAMKEERRGAAQSRNHLLTAEIPQDWWEPAEKH